MIHYYLRTIHDERLRKIPEYQVGCLIYCEEPTADNLNFLKNKFSLNESLLQDALDIYELPRIEEDDGKVYIFLRASTLNNGSDEKRNFTLPILIVISNEFLLFFSKEKVDFLKSFLKEDKLIFTTQRTRLLFKIISKIIEIFHQNLLKVNKDIKRVIFDRNIEEEEIKQLIKYEFIVEDFLNNLIGIRLVIESLLEKRYLNLFLADKKLIEDLKLDIRQLEEMAKSSVKNIVNIREGHEIIFTNVVNKTIKILTAYTIIVSIPTIIASFYGMNVKLPLGDYPPSFFIILMFSFLLMGILYFIFKLKKWL